MNPRIYEFNDDEHEVPRNFRQIIKLKRCFVKLTNLPPANWSAKEQETNAIKTKDYLEKKSGLNFVDSNHDRNRSEESYLKVLKLRQDLLKALALVDMVKKRERTKREYLQLNVEILKKRYDEEYMQSANEIQPGDRPLENEIQPGDRPLANEIQPGDRPLENEIQPGGRPLENEIQPGDRPLENEIQPGGRPLENEIQPGGQPLNNENWPRNLKLREELKSGDLTLKKIIQQDDLKFENYDQPDDPTLGINLQFNKNPMLKTYNQPDDLMLERKILPDDRSRKPKSFFMPSDKLIANFEERWEENITNNFLLKAATFPSETEGIAPSIPSVKKLFPFSPAVEQPCPKKDSLIPNLYSMLNVLKNKQLQELASASRVIPPSMSTQLPTMSQATSPIDRLSMDKITYHQEPLDLSSTGLESNGRPLYSQPSSHKKNYSINFPNGSPSGELSIPKGSPCPRETLIGMTNLSRQLSPSGEPKITDEEMESLSVKDFNEKLKYFPTELQHKYKMRRQTLKKRSYCRQKRDYRKMELESINKVLKAQNISLMQFNHNNFMQIEQLAKVVKLLIEENEALRGSNKASISKTCS